MTRDHILSVVRNHLARSLDIDSPESLDPELSMKEHGANSLDIVEIVSASMRELRVKVPRAELADIQNIDGLVDLLHRTAQVKGMVAWGPETPAGFPPHTRASATRCSCTAWGQTWRRPSPSRIGWRRWRQTAPSPSRPPATTPSARTSPSSVSRGSASSC